MARIQHCGRRMSDSRASRRVPATSVLSAFLLTALAGAPAALARDVTAGAYDIITLGVANPMGGDAVVRLTPNGLVAGNGAGLAWVYASGASQVVGPGGHEYTSRSVVGMTNAGYTGGAANRRLYRSPSPISNTDAWLDRGDGPTIVTPLGYPYEQINQYGDVIRMPSDIQVNSRGHLVGFIRRVPLNFSNNYYNSDIFFADGQSTRIINPTMFPYSQDLSHGTYRWAEILDFRNSDLVVGHSWLYPYGGREPGYKDIWVFDGQQTRIANPVGSPFDLDTNGKLLRTAEFRAASDDGTVIGLVWRQAPYSGAEAWAYHAGVTRLLGPTGYPYDYYERRFTNSGAVNAAGLISGIASRYTQAGNDAGTDSWIDDRGVVTIIPLPAGPYETPVDETVKHVVRATVLNAARGVAGPIDRYGDAVVGGQDVMVYDGSTSRIANLTGPGYEWTSAGTVRRQAYLNGFNDAGQAVGVSNRFRADGQRLGSDIFFFDGASARVVNPTGPGFEYSVAGQVRRGPDENTVLLNASGVVAGTATRFTAGGVSLGRAAWVFNPATGVTTTIVMATSPTNNTSWHEVQQLTDTGLLIGTYHAYNPIGVDQGERAFIWSATSGVMDLGALVQDGLAATGWQYLSLVEPASTPGVMGTQPDGSPTYIVGRGRRVGASADAPFLMRFRTTCPVDFNNDGVLNQEDLAGFITAYLAEPDPVPGPSGTSNAPCPGATPPYDVLGYAADFNRDCGLDQEDLSGFITEFFTQIENPTACVAG